MTTLREAAAMALQALEESRELVWDAYASDWRHGIPTRKAQLDSVREAAEKHDGAIAALKAALEQPVQEPVAWLYRDHNGQLRLNEIQPKSYFAFPVYTAPPQRKPLTEEEIIDAVRDADFDWMYGWTLDETQGNRFATLARAIERAHGVGA